MPTTSTRRRAIRSTPRMKIEGFLFNGQNAERSYNEPGKFEYVNTGGYYHSLPGDPLRELLLTPLRKCAARHGFPERERSPGSGAIAIRNQLRLRRSRCCCRSDPALQADLPSGGHQHGIYRVLPAEPVVGVNGNGMHTNVSISKKAKNLFWDPKARKNSASSVGSLWIAFSATATISALLINSSVNRVPPARSALRGAQSAQCFSGQPRRHGAHPHRQREEHAHGGARRCSRLQPLQVMYSIFKTGLDGEIAKIKNLRSAQRYLPDNIYTALENFEKAEWTTTLSAPTSRLATLN